MKSDEMQETKSDTLLELKTQWGGTERVSLEISQYVNNGCIYIGLVSCEDEFPEPYGDLTVNLSGKVPDYCGYVDLNNMPELEQFIEENKLGEFTGLVKRSGYCEYPLYLFDANRLNELCPDGMQAYEAGIGKGRDSKVTERAR